MFIMLNFKKNSLIILMLYISYVKVWSYFASLSASSLEQWDQKEK